MKYSNTPSRGTAAPHREGAGSDRGGARYHPLPGQEGTAHAGSKGGDRQSRRNTPRVLFFLGRESTTPIIGYGW